MKLHLGAGDVYLTGYVNIDLDIPGYSFLVSERPDLVERNHSTLEYYYKNPYPLEPQGFECVVDRFDNIVELLSYPDNSVDEIICIQTFEHLSRGEAGQSLRRWYEILKPGGRLLIDVPDFERLALGLIREADDQKRAWYYRMLFGSQKNTGAFHKDGYDVHKLLSLLEQHGFVGVRSIGGSPHPYPTVVMESFKR